jgi:hypothetical protein
MDNRLRKLRRTDRLVGWIVLAVSAGLAAASARPFAGSWNDGSRLATVESLVDQHTWRIDDSIFVRVPPADEAHTPLPYDAAEADLLRHGTLDKLLIDGHFYSDKSPLPALPMASCYQLWRWATGWTARTHPAQFCRGMTLLTSGVSYVLAVLCIYRLGSTLRLPLPWRLALTSSFALATLALPYARYVNNHILLLATTCALVLGIASLPGEMRKGAASWSRFVGMGVLSGLGYSIDLGVGPVLLATTALLILSLSWCPNAAASPAMGPPRMLRPRVTPVLLFLLGALPCLLLHHALNYAIGGTLTPTNAHAEFFRWPGSPFRDGNLTGSWIRRDPFSFLLYAASMLGGKRGFLGHNLPLFLTVPGLVILLRWPMGERKGVLWATGFCGVTWLLYAATSNNSSGQCCSIRWFVPLLAPGYYVLARLLKEHPRYRIDFLILSAWGVLLVLLMWDGPWTGRMVPFFWPIQAAALVSWALWHVLRCRASLEAHTQHPYTNGWITPPPPGTAAFLLWTTAASSSEGRANTTCATSTSTCHATNSSSSPE